MTMPTLSTDEKEKLKRLTDEGCRVLAEIAALREGLKETVNAIAEELDIPKKTLNKAIRTAYKSDFHNQKEEFDELDELLEVIGRK